MKLHTLHKGCGGLIEIDIRLTLCAIFYSAACDRCGNAAEGRKKRPTREWEGQDNATMRLGGLPERSL